MRIIAIYNESSLYAAATLQYTRWKLHSVFLEWWVIEAVFSNWYWHFLQQDSWFLTVYFFALAQLGWHCCLCRYGGQITTSILCRLRPWRFHPCRDAQKVSTSPSACLLRLFETANDQLYKRKFSRIYAAVARLLFKLVEPMPLWQGFRTYAVVTRVLLTFAKPMPLWQGFCSSLSCLTVLCCRNI